MQCRTTDPGLIVELGQKVVLGLNYCVNYKPEYVGRSLRRREDVRCGRSHDERSSEGFWNSLKA